MTIKNKQLASFYTLLKQASMGFVMLVCLVGCKETNSQTAYERAQSALDNGNIEQAASHLYQAMRQKAAQQAQNFADLLNDSEPQNLEKQHDLVAQCDSAECRNTLKQFGERQLASIASSSELNNFSLEEISIMSKLIHQGQQGMFLASCILMDAMTLFEGLVGRDQQPQVDELKGLLKQIDKLDVVGDVAAGGSGLVYQLAKNKGRKAANTKNCRQASQAYNEFKVEVGKIMGKIHAPDIQIDRRVRKSFYHGMLKERYRNIVKKSNEVVK